MANIDEPTGDALLVIRNMAKTQGASPFESLNKDGGKELADFESRTFDDWRGASGTTDPSNPGFKTS